MFEVAKHERAPYPEHPDRCEHNTSNGQCPYLKVHGSNKCELHGAIHRQSSLETKATKIYLAAQWQAHAGPFSESDQIKSLREEIGILRMLLNKILASCHTENDLLMRSSSISELILKIQKVVESCHKLESLSGALLDKEELNKFGQTVITLVSSYISDPDTLQAFAQALVGEIKRAGTQELASRQ